MDNRHAINSAMEKQRASLLIRHSLEAKRRRTLPCVRVGCFEICLREQITSQNVLYAAAMSYPGDRIAAGTTVGSTRFSAGENTSHKGTSCAIASSSNRRQQRLQSLTQTGWICLERF
jgi:hypothetical protein